MPVPSKKTLSSKAGDAENPQGSRPALESAGDGMNQIMVTRVGLQVPGGLSFEMWERAGRRLAEVMNSSAWCIGDWVEHGERKFTGRYRRVVEQVGLEYQTVRNYAWVARCFPIERRRLALSFQHHAEVASLPSEEQDVWLDRAERLGWSRNALRRALRAARSPSVAQQSTMPLSRIAAEQERLERWQSAAERTTGNFERWILESLDRAAAAVLDPVPSPPNERS